MGAGDKDANMTIGADGSQADAEFNRLAQSAMTAGQRVQTAFREAGYNMAHAMTQSVDKVNSEFSRVIDVAKHMQGAMLAITAVLAGGKMFKDTVDATVNMTKEFTALSKALGITVTEASVLSVALGDIYQSSDTLLAANKAMTKQLVGNEDAFKNLGVATRDQNGNYRNSLDIMLDVNQRLLEFKEGTDRNVEGVKIYGKAWGEVQGTLKLNADLMVESRKKAHELGLVVGQENVQATSRYRAAMNDMGDVLKAMQKAVGDALLPVLTQLGEWFADIGPVAVLALKGAVGGLVGVFHAIKLAAQEAWELIALSIELATVQVARFVNVAMKVLSGDFSGAIAVWDAGTATINELVAKRTANMVKHVEDAQKKIWELFANPTATAAKTGGAHSGGDEEGKKDSTRTAAWKSELEQKLETERNFFKSSLDEELGFWQSKLALITGNSKQAVQERQQVRHEIFALEKRQAQEQLAFELEDLKARAASYRTGSVERIRLAGEAAAKIGEKYGLESKEYRAALKDMEQAAREHQAHLLKLEDERVQLGGKKKLQGLEMDRLGLDLKKQLGQINAVQELQALRALEEQKYQIELQALRDKAALYGADTQEYADAMRRIEELAGQHRIVMQKSNNQIVTEQKNAMVKMMEPVTRAVDQSVQGMILGTTTLQKAMQNIFQSILAQFVNMAVKMGVEWVVMELVKTRASQATSVAQQAASGATVAAKSTEAMGVVGANAAEAASGAAASQAAIPFAGPVMAAAAFASIMALVMGARSSIPAARGGYDIPAGINPLTQLHQEEMVLPAHLANPMRDLLASGGGGGMIVNIHATDAQSVKRLLFNNKAAVADALKAALRDFKR